MNFFQCRDPQFCASFERSEQPSVEVDTITGHGILYSDMFGVFATSKRIFSQRAWYCLVHQRRVLMSSLILLITSNISFSRLEECHRSHSVIGV